MKMKIRLCILAAVGMLFCVLHLAPNSALSLALNIALSIMLVFLVIVSTPQIDGFHKLTFFDFRELVNGFLYPSSDTPELYFNKASLKRFILIIYVFVALLVGSRVLAVFPLIIALCIMLVFMVFMVFLFRQQIVVFIKAAFYYFLERVSGFFYPADDTFEPGTLTNKLCLFRNFMQECEQRAILDKSSMVNLKELKKWVDDAQDVIDLHGNEGRQIDMRAWSRTRKYFLRDLGASGKNIEKIYDRIGGHLPVNVDDSDRLVYKNLKRDLNFQEERPGIYGREKVQKKLLEGLISEVHNVTIFPIVGPGGVGKTTLAHWIYSHPILPDRFDIKGWTNYGSCVSDLTFILKKIVEAFTRKLFDSTDLNSLKRKVQEEVLGRRFLLLLDNVPREVLSLLGDVCALFSGVNVGKIVVTTREEDVASFVVDKVELEPPFVLGCLDDGDSWLIVRDCIHKAHPDEMEYNFEIGKQLAFKCNGLPLSIRVLGSALRFERCREENWQGILASEIWKFDEINGGVLPALKISYSCMKAELRHCFVLLSMFPQGHVFYENDVFRLWMSLGLIQAEEGGKLYFNELLQRSMIERAKGDGENSGFTMHDLVHDLTEAYALDDFLAVQAEGLYSSPRHVRYLSVIVSNLVNSVDLIPLEEHRDLRVLQIVHRRNKCKNDNTPLIKIKLSDRLFRNLEHLKALVLSMTQIKALPDSIGNLKLLRYLDLKNTGIERLPDNICNLYYLQTLDVTNCPLKEIPKGMENLVNLEYLFFEWKFSLCMPRGIGKLKRLRVLPRFDIKKGKWHCTVDELKGLQELTGELCIAGLGNIASAEEVDGALLLNKHYLQVLRLDWSTGPRPCSHLRKGKRAEESANDVHVHCEQVFRRLQPHTNLEALHVYGYPGFEYPSWLGNDSFNKLVKISLVGTNEGPNHASLLSAFKGTEKSCEALPPLGGLPSLKALFIKSMWNVLAVGCEFYCCSEAFPSLEILKFDDMLNWVDWRPVPSHGFKSLRALRITDCPKLNFIPYLLSSTKMVSLSLNGELNQDLFRELQMPTLKTLKVCFSRNIRLLRLDSQNIPSLEALLIHRCQKLRTIVGLGELESLQVMKMHACENLQFSLNQQLPPKLTHLAISSSPKVENWMRLQKLQKFDDHKHRGELKALAQLSNTDDADEI